LIYKLFRRKFYHKDYKYVGKLVGRYYNEKGEVTDEWKKLQVKKRTIE